MTRSKKALIGIVLMISVTLSSFAALTFMRATKAQPPPMGIVRPDPPVILIPPSTVGDIAVTVEDFYEVIGFQVKVYWLKDVVEYAGHSWKPPPIWPNYLPAGPIFEENATHKAVTLGIIDMPPLSPFSSSEPWAFIDLYYHCIRPEADTPLIFDRFETFLISEVGEPIPIVDFVDGTITNPPLIMYWKENYIDYAPSGVPDFDQRQDKWNATCTGKGPVPPFWSWCAPTAVANSLWWMDSRYESSTTPPPTIKDTFPLVTSYKANIDDHDPANVPPFIEHLSYLMDTDGRRTGTIIRIGTNVFDMQVGIAHYLSWTGLNPPGDVNGDGKVNQTDWNIVKASIGSSISGGVPQGPWNMAADIWPVTLGWPNPGVADNKVDARDLNLVVAYMNSTGYFYEKTVIGPEFYFVEDEVERCEDVILSIGFYRKTNGIWQREHNASDWPSREIYDVNIGHAVTVVGVNSTTLQIAISDPGQDNAEKTGVGRVLPPGNHGHPANPPHIIHNNATFVSHDVYNINNTWLPPLVDQHGNPVPANFSIVNYNNPWGLFPLALAVVEHAIIISPLHPPPPRPQGELTKLIHIVEWPGTVAYSDIPFDSDALSGIEGYEQILTHLEEKGFMFDPADGTAMNVTGNITVGNVTGQIGIVWVEEFSGNVTSWWSNNTLEDGTRACILSAQMDDDTSMAMAFVTNLLPPEQVPGVDPHIIVNAMPYMYVRFYWWSWYPIGEIVSWSYWWYDSHSHPNWFWGPYWWWRCYVKAYFQGLSYRSFPWAYWRPWWGWWWHWIYWRHWYWWSTYFPYDP